MHLPGPLRVTEDEKSRVHTAREVGPEYVTSLEVVKYCFVHETKRKKQRTAYIPGLCAWPLISKGVVSRKREGNEWLGVDQLTGAKKRAASERAGVG
jgi:hypothetical protein